MKKRTTIDDVAREAGVSRQTVSRAINGMEGINANTRARIMEMVDEMGYRPSRLARGMAGSQSQTIGFIIGNITNPALAKMVQGFHDAAEERNHNVFLRHTNNCKERELEALKSLMDEKVDGIVISSPRIEKSVLKSFADRDCPIIVLHRNIEAPYISSITTDTKRATGIAVEYLLGSGHKHIGLITRPGDIQLIRHLWGYKQTLIARNIKYRDNYVVQGETTLRGGYEATYRLLSQNSKITALTTYNDLMALGAMKACADLGKKVSQDISIIGYDDIDMASYVSPALTTLRFKGYDVGVQAFKHLISMIERPEESFPPTILDIELVIRNSTSSI